MSVPRLSFSLSILFLLALATAQLACDARADHGPRSAERLWNDLGCVNCHAPDGTGLPGFGPTLHGKKSLWTRDELVAYLRDPTGYAMRDPRLRVEKKKYMAPMPPVTTPDQAEVQRLIDHVLAMP